MPAKSFSITWGPRANLYGCRCSRLCSSHSARGTQSVARATQPACREDHSAKREEQPADLPNLGAGDANAGGILPSIDGIRSKSGRKPKQVAGEFARLAGEDPKTGRIVP